MLSTNKVTQRFWTKGRLALTTTALCAVVLASSCTSPDTARDNTNAPANNAKGSKPVVTVTQQRGPQQPPAQPNAAPSDTLPPEVLNAQITSLDGKTLRISDYKNKVLVLNLWATWCGPCRQEIPHMVELSREYAGKGVELVGLTTENPKTDEQKVRAFAKEYNISYTLGWADSELAAGLMRGHYSIPQTFVIAPGGRVVAHYRGFSQNLPTMLRAALDKATNRTTGD